MANPNFVALYSTDEIYWKQDVTKSFADELDAIIESIPEAVDPSDFAEADHNHDGVYAPATHSHTDYADADHNHDTVYAAASHTHPAAVITAHMENSTYNAPIGGTFTNVPLNNLVLTGSGLSLVANQVKIGAGISKVKVSAQVCVGSTNVEGNKYLAIRKNATYQLARTQIRLHEAYTPETFCIPSILVDVQENDLLTIDYWGTEGDTLYGDLVFTYLTVEKIV